MLFHIWKNIYLSGKKLQMFERLFFLNKINLIKHLKSKVSGHLRYTDIKLIKIHFDVINSVVSMHNNIDLILNSRFVEKKGIILQRG